MGIGKDWSVEEIDLDPPQTRRGAGPAGGSGLCHSDEHLVTGDAPVPLPIIGGHEGAGVVEEVGPGRGLARARRPRGLRLHPVLRPVPARASTGHENLCDLGATIGDRAAGPTAPSRHHAAARTSDLMCLLGTFAEHTVVNEASCIKVDPTSRSTRPACWAAASVTGWGSAVYAAEVTPGDDVAVVGVGGIGINAVQGAKLAGAHRIFAIDPVEFKRDKAMEFGATHTPASMEEAHGPHPRRHPGPHGQQGDHDHGRRARRRHRRRPGPHRQAGTGRRHQPPPAPKTQVTDERPRPDPHGEAGRRVAVRLGQSPVDIPRLLELDRQGQLDLEGWSPGPTPSRGSTPATAT